MGGDKGEYYSPTGVCSGAFVRNSTTTPLTQGHYDAYKPSGFSFDASRSSSIYGNSDNVQPQSMRITFIIKY